MKTINNYITEKLHINKDTKAVKYDEPKIGDLCYDIGGNDHKILDYAELSDNTKINDLLLRDKMSNSYDKKSIKNFISKKKYEKYDYEYLVLVSQEQGDDYTGFWGTKECDEGWPNLYYKINEK